MKTLAIVVPTYNRKVLLVQTVNSFLRQQIPENWRLQVVVVDDGSTDGTQAHLRENIFDTRLHYLHQQNAERGAARNLGAGYAIRDLEADWLLFFDSDDCMLDGALEAYFNSADAATEDAVGIYSQYDPWDGGLVRLTPIKTDAPEGDLSRQLMRKQILPMGATIVRAKSFLRVGGFSQDRAMSGSEDFHFLVRLGLYGRILHLPHKTMLYRQHIGNTHPSNYLRSTDVAAAGLESSVRAKWPGRQADLAYQDLRRLCELSKVGALNQTGYVNEAWRAWWALAQRDRRAILETRFWRLLLGIGKSYLRELKPAGSP